MRKKWILLGAAIICLSFPTQSTALTDTNACRLFLALDGHFLKCEKILEFNIPADSIGQFDSIKNFSSEDDAWILGCFDKFGQMLFSTRINLGVNAGGIRGETWGASTPKRFSAAIPRMDSIFSCRLICKKKRAHDDDVLAMEVVAECRLDGSPRFRASELIKTLPPILHVEKIQDWGPDKNRVTHVFLSAYYLSDQMDAYHNRVDDFLKRPIWGMIDPWSDGTIDGMFHADVYKQFQKAFNLYIVDIPDFDADAFWRESGEMEERKILLDEYLRDYIPDPPDGYDIVCLKTGSVAGYPVGRVYTNTPSTYVMHKLGHSLAALEEESDADSASGPVGPPNEEIRAPNVTIDSNLADLKWKHWVEDPTIPFPTPMILEFRDAVGAFLGANRSPDYFYRPQPMCLMRALPHSKRGLLFCKICREEMTIQMLTKHINIFDSTSHDWDSILPIYAANKPSLYADVVFDNALFSCIVDPKIVWYLDDQPKPQWGDQANLNVTTASIPPGNHVIKIGVLGLWRGTEGFIRKNVDTNFYYSFPWIEIAKGKTTKKK